MSDMHTASQDALDEARRKGWRVMVPTAHEFFVDLDSESAYEAFLVRVEKAIDMGFVSGYEIKPSKSGIAGRYHAVVRTLERIETPLFRIALQAILGSDWLRELLSLNRLREGDALPTLFFEKP